VGQGLGRGRDLLGIERPLDDDSEVRVGDRLMSGAFTSKKGFSVVAPIRVTMPPSTAGRRASCWLLLNRWTSSRKRMVPSPCSASSLRAASMTSRTSLTPAVTAERDTK
jgi:hypothetical protein